MKRRTFALSTAAALVAPAVAPRRAAGGVGREQDPMPRARLELARHRLDDSLRRAGAEHPDLVGGCRQGKEGCKQDGEATHGRVSVFFVGDDPSPGTAPRGGNECRARRAFLPPRGSG